MPVHPLVLWSARLCTACYLGRYLADVSGAKRMREWCWTSGWVLLVLHVMAAFQFVHGWSHAAAVAHTAEQTEAMVGIDWGGGVWFNYATIVIWGADVAWRFDSSCREKCGRASLAWSVFVHSYLAAMMISATVIFGPTYWWAIAVLFGAIWFVLRSIHSKRKAGSP
jgi:hypothetical protein